MPRRSLEGPKKAPDLVPRNSRGGVLVTDDELKSAFEFFDAEGSGKITQVRSRRLALLRVALTPSTRLVFIREGAGWSFFRL